MCNVEYATRQTYTTRKGYVIDSVVIVTRMSQNECGSCIVFERDANAYHVIDVDNRNEILNTYATYESARARVNDIVASLND